MSGLHITGLNELTSSLLREVADAPKVASEVVGKVAQHVKDTAKSMAPTGPTGDLKESIRVDVLGDRTTREVGPTVRYGEFVEFGTYKDAPQPFMGPAADRHESELESELLRAIGNL